MARVDLGQGVPALCVPERAATMAENVARLTLGDDSWDAVELLLAEVVGNS